MTVPRRQSVTGRRLCSGILTKGYFTFGDIAKGGFEDDGNRGKTDEAHEGEDDVVAGEDGPGFHLFFVTEVSMACQGAERKCGLPPVLFEVVYCTLQSWDLVFGVPQH